MSSTQDLLNSIIQEMLPALNSGIKSSIKNSHLDPWGQVAHGSKTLGSIKWKFIHADAKADYNVKNLRGLSTFEIKGLEITNVQQNPHEENQYIGTIKMKALFANNISANVGGDVSASFMGVGKSVGISGSISVSGIKIASIGSFTADTENSKTCLESVNVSDLIIDYGKVDVSIDGLGFFNKFLSKLTNAVASLVKSQVKTAIANALKPIINEEIRKMMPRCS